MIHELPPTGVGTPEQQIAALRDYLVRLARELDGVSASETVIREAAGRAADSAQKKTMEEVRSRAEYLKALIVKTADEVESYADSRIAEYASLYVAKSEYGSYYQQIERQVADTARGTVESYNYSDAIESAQTAADSALAAAETYYTELTGQIRRGVMEDPVTHELHLGIAIAENLEFTGVVEEHGGMSYYRLASGQTLGLYTSRGWQFWINGRLCGYFSSEDNMLHVANIIADEKINFATDWEITTDGGFGIRYIGS